MLNLIKNNEAIVLNKYVDLLEMIKINIFRPQYKFYDQIEWDTYDTGVDKVHNENSEKVFPSHLN